jgi:hypothetical protein
MNEENKGDTQRKEKDWTHFVDVVGKEKKEGIAEGIKLTGEITFIHRDKEGNVKEIDVIKNLVVNKGKEIAAKLLNGVVTNFFDYIQIGTGTTAPVPGNTALETYYSEGAATCAYEADYKAKLSYTFAFSEVVTITESGVFDGPHGGAPNMLARQTFSGKAMGVGESLEVVWTTTVG